VQQDVSSALRKQVDLPEYGLQIEKEGSVGIAFSLERSGVPQTMEQGFGWKLTVEHRHAFREQIALFLDRQERIFEGVQNPTAEVSKADGALHGLFQQCDGGRKRATHLWKPLAGQSKESLRVLRRRKRRHKAAIIPVGAFWEEGLLHAHPPVGDSRAPPVSIPLSLDAIHGLTDSE
jgi:hypothetical protein